MNKLNPKAKTLFFVQAFFIDFFITLLFFLMIMSIVDSIRGGISMRVLFSFFFILPFTFLAGFVLRWWVKMAYNRYTYELKKDGIHITKGVIFQKYTIIPYKKVQNINVTHDPISRWLGLATVQVQTAGMSGQATIEGVIPGLLPETAVLLRDEILKKVDL